MSLKPDIDPKTGKVEPPIELGGKPEFLASDGAGKVYIHLEDKDQVAVVDMKARKVVAHWPAAPGGAPVGMSIDPSKGRLFIGCRKPQKVIVMSTISMEKLLLIYPSELVLTQPSSTETKYLPVAVTRTCGRGGNVTGQVRDRAKRQDTARS